MKSEEQIIRIAKNFGNGAHIFVPKGWVGEQIILVKPQKKDIKERIISALNQHLDSIIGAYLFGSYARGEQSEDSDIDLFIVADKKIIIYEKDFEVTCLEQKEIEKAIKLEPILLYSIFSEAKPIINSKLLEELRSKHKPSLNDFNEFFKDCKRMIKVNEDFLESEKNEFISSEAVIYSLVLRMRGLFIIKSLLKENKYSLRLFKTWIKSKLPRINFSAIYKAYKDSKNEKKIKQKIKTSDIRLLLNLLNKEISILENG